MRASMPSTLPQSSGTNKGFVASLATMNGIAGRVKALADANPRWMSAAVRKELAFLGADNIANKSAVENLNAMGQQKGAKARYLRYGDKTGLETLLPGVKVHVLGPPDLTQTDAIRKQRSKDRDQFWHLVSGAVPVRTSAQLAAASGKSNGHSIPAEARWFRDRLQSLSGQGLLEIVRQLDQQMNNTSLILLFEVKGRDCSPAMRSSRTGVTRSRKPKTRRRSVRCSRMSTSIKSGTTAA